MPSRKSSRRTKTADELTQKTTEDLAEAEESFRQARREHATQARKLEQEKESVVARFERLARGNHLAELALRALTEGYDHGRR